MENTQQTKWSWKQKRPIFCKQLFNIYKPQTRTNIKTVKPSPGNHRLCRLYQISDSIHSLLVWISAVSMSESYNIHKTHDSTRYKILRTLKSLTGKDVRMFERSKQTTQSLTLAACIDLLHRPLAWCFSKIFASKENKHIETYNYATTTQYEDNNGKLAYLKRPKGRQSVHIVQSLPPTSNTEQLTVSFEVTLSNQA